MTRLLLLLLLIPGICFAQNKPYRDLTHESAVFGKTKTYRLYLPESYNSSTSRYPVIYFFHGWGGRYYKDDSALLEYEMLGELVNKYQVIMVMWDGNIDLSEPRPYNVGNHEDVKFQVQMKDYFPEFAEHIDSSLRTIADRDNRGIIGFSMGGFMSAYIGGKYPDMVSAIVNMVGSPEFFVGHPDNHTLYPVRYTLDNLKDISFRFHYMDNCPLYFMSTEIKNAAELYNFPRFEYWLGKGDHKVDDPGETKVFEMAMRFIRNRFDNPVKPDRTWSHYDIYPSFGLWGYSVVSNKSEPGFLYLRNVSPTGFGFYTYKWLPDGVSIPCTATVTTPPIYKKGGTYELTFYKQNEKTPVISRIKADKEGRLSIDMPGENYEVSISDKSQQVDFIVSGYKLDSGSKFINVNKEDKINISLLARGAGKDTDRKVIMTVTCNESAVKLTNAVQEIQPGKETKKLLSQPIGLSCNKTPPDDATPPWVKLNVEINCDGIISHDAITVPVYYDVPYFSHIRIDDGLGVRGGPNGTGNINGIAEPSEKIILFENYQRLRLYTDDPYVEQFSEGYHYEMITSGIWPDGFSRSSIVKIADNCPPGHTIEFLACYETKTFMPIQRKVVWGKVKIEVK